MTCIDLLPCPGPGPHAGHQPEARLGGGGGRVRAAGELQAQGQVPADGEQDAVYTDHEDADHDDHDAGDVHGDDAARGGEAGQELPEETRGGQHWNCGPPGGEDGAGHIFCN